MYRLISFAILLLGSQLPLVHAQAEEANSEMQLPPERLPLEQLLSEKDLAKFKKEEKYHNRLKIIRNTMESKNRLLRHYVDDTDIANSYRGLAALRGLAFHALQQSLEEKNRKELRHKEVKRLEIWLRKSEEELEDLKLEVPLENRFQFEETVRLLEELREQLLRQLFGQALGSRTDESMGFLPSGGVLGRPVLAQGLVGLDRFTDDEFTQIQLARELVKRVEVFILIAENRLNEIERRVEGREWEKDEPNPLEFHTYEDMLHAYTRAIDGIMINIDEQATSGMTEEGDIRKALKLLSKKIEEFTPRLEALKQLVIERQDQPLGEKLIKAMETSEIARKGAQYGLGAPERDK